MAALKAAVDQLRMGDVDIAVVGGADQMMDPPAYIKFSKIGALSAEKSAPFDASANGFVMGEGVGVLILKRLEDAERDGNKIYAVITGVGGSSDGKGKGIMAPNPKGQRLALERASTPTPVSTSTPCHCSKLTVRRRSSAIRPKLASSPRCSVNTALARAAYRLAPSSR